MYSGAERRKRIRHKLHTPVYASFTGPDQGMVLDLSELLDIHEDGFAAQTSDPLEIDRTVNVCLDLPETKTYIHATGHVIWADPTGRAGIRFTGLADYSRRLLKEWLFVNLLIACANHNGRPRQKEPIPYKPPDQLPAPASAVSAIPYKPPDQLPAPEASVPAIAEKPPAPASAAPAPVADLSALLVAVDAVRRELRAYDRNFDAAVQIVTERALSLTSATGAALAFLTNGEMLCRGSAGQPAPPLGSTVDVRHGFSGECVRSASTINCEDTETDSRVDREICRALGIGSIMATPIVSNFRVVGVLEVLSPLPRAFAKIHEIVLERLAELVPKAEPPTPSSGLPHEESSPTSTTNPIPDESPQAESQIEDGMSGVSVRWGRLSLLVATVAMAALALGYVLAPTIEKRWFMKPETAVQAATTDTSSAAIRETSGPMSLADLRRLADQGDPDAQWNMGVRYHNGEGVPQDDAIAVQWFLRAAEQGHVIAQGTLGAYYWAGRGVPQDLSKAYFWSALALAQGDDASKSRLEGLASQMTRGEVIAARQQAEAWIREHSTTTRK